MDSLSLQEPVSPELVLVDPELAARQRALLELRAPAPRRPFGPTPVRPEPPVVRAAQPSPRLMRLRPALGRLAAAACVAALVAPYAVAAVRTHAVGRSVVRAAVAGPDLRRAGPGAAQPPATKAKRQPTTGEGRTFAWAPVPRAASYEVQIYRGPTRIFRRATATPSIVVPPAWRYDGRARRLTRGDYRWYVWPLDRDGDRAAVAVVRARLHVD